MTIMNKAVFIKRCLNNCSPLARTWRRDQIFRHGLVLKKRQYATASTRSLAQNLAEAIKQSGPITLAQYMRQCLTATDGGYYTTSQDPFGKKGDFITSPEISQLFGEMVGIWLVTEWMAQTKNNGMDINIIELGPGRGTLMEDVLRTMKSFKYLNGQVKEISLVEASPILREMQCKLLCGKDASPLKSEIGWKADSLFANIPINWYGDISLIPQNNRLVPYIIAHEFFDALPIHAFQATTAGWRELLVNVKTQQQSTLILPSHIQAERASSNSIEPTFELTLSKAPTVHSVILPTLSPRYAALSKKVNSTVEISYDSHSVVKDITSRIAASKQGTALIIDYGPLDTIPINSLRGIKAHKRVSPFEEPGKIDLSVDVDFMALVETALNASEDVEVHGPAQQGDFLLSLGLKERLQVLLKNANEEHRKTLQGGYDRIVDRGVQGMGRLYKALAIIPEAGCRRPIGFGGNLTM